MASTDSCIDCNGLWLAASHLTVCQHCGGRFCSVHFPRHIAAVDFNLKTIPQLMRKPS
jgi:uncharacterized UBP type Zn finger protein